MLKIVADENIPELFRYFSSLGAITTVAGRDLCASDVIDADILLVRSVTRVDASLLAGSAVRFVATATIGIDHLDIDYLNSRGITWVNAPGCNADSVVDYVFSNFSRISNLWERLFSGVRVGIVGYGNVGSRLYERLRCLGINSIVYDPLLNQAPQMMSSLAAVLNCEVVCLHAPLTTKGKYPSQYMIGAQELIAMKPDAVLISAGRGAVVDNQALKGHLLRKGQFHASLDVWEGEPVIDQELLDLISIATPHIAGYSWDGKVAGTRMIYEACSDFLQASRVDVGGDAPLLEICLLSSGVIEGLNEAILAVYDVKSDDVRLREALASCAEGGCGKAFDRLRKNYPKRREFTCIKIKNSNELSEPLRCLLSAVGFVVA